MTTPAATRVHGVPDRAPKSATALPMAVTASAARHRDPRVNARHCSASVSKGWIGDEDRTPSA
jgi:hypothetical protein